MLPAALTTVWANTKLQNQQTADIHKQKLYEVFRKYLRSSQVAGPKLKCVTYKANITCLQYRLKVHVDIQQLF